MDFPAEHWKQISSTNPWSVVGIFRTEKSLICLIGAVLADQNDEWAVSRKYMSRHSLGRIYQSSTPEIEGEVTHAVAIPIH